MASGMFSTIWAWISIPGGMSALIMRTGYGLAWGAWLLSPLSNLPTQSFYFTDITASAWHSMAHRRIRAVVGRSGNFAPDFRLVDRAIRFPVPRLGFWKPVPDAKLLGLDPCMNFTFAPFNPAHGVIDFVKQHRRCHFVG